LSATLFNKRGSYALGAGMKDSECKANPSCPNWDRGMKYHLLNHHSTASCPARSRWQRRAHAHRPADRQAVRFSPAIHETAPRQPVRNAVHDWLSVFLP